MIRRVPWVSFALPILLSGLFMACGGDEGPTDGGTTGGGTTDGGPSYIPPGTGTGNGPQPRLQGYQPSAKEQQCQQNALNTCTQDQACAALSQCSAACVQAGGTEAQLNGCFQGCFQNSTQQAAQVFMQAINLATACVLKGTRKYCIEPCPGACQQDTGCVAINTCVGNCGQDSNCANACVQKAPAASQAAYRGMATCYQACDRQCFEGSMAHCAADDGCKAILECTGSCQNQECWDNCRRQHPESDQRFVQAVNIFQTQCK